MKAIAKLVALHGGMGSLEADAIRIENPPFVRLCVEHAGYGPRGLPMLSIAHYHEVAGDLIADPDATFEVVPDADGLLPEDIREWGPVAIQHGTGLYFPACWRDEEGKIVLNHREVRDQRSFARMWSRNIIGQGFLDAFQADRK